MKATCKVENCDRPHSAKGACRVHYERFRKFGNYGLPPRQVDLPCAVPNCGRSAKAEGICGGHWKRKLDHGDVRAHIPLKPQGTNRGACSVPSCERKATVRNVCRAHYYRIRRFGDTRPDVPLMYQTPMAGLICSVEACKRPAKTRGWCGAHYLRWLKTGEVRDNVAVRFVRREPEPCVIPSCNRVQVTLGWCGGHYQRWQTYGDVRADIPFRPIRPGAVCSEDGCGEPHLAQGLCHYHYGQVWRAANADTLREIQNRRRSRMAGNQVVPVSNEALAAKVSYWGHRCWICRGAFEAIDHVKPVFAGGAHMLSNLRPICVRCNSSKGHQWPFPTRTVW